MTHPLTTALDSAVRDMVEGKDVAVAFSGGLDSGLVAALASKHARSVKLYTVGVEGSHDVIASEEMATELGLSWEHILIDEDNLREGLKTMISVTGTMDPVMLSFEVPLLYILPHVDQEYIIGGQGADELFCGYSKYVGMTDEELREGRARDMASLMEQTYPHEKKMADRFGKTVLYPFLDQRVRDVADSLSMSELRPVGDDRKFQLRETAMDLGYGIIASKKKKATQYGTGSMNLIKKMAKASAKPVGDFIKGLAYEGSRE